MCHRGDHLANRRQPLGPIQLIFHIDELRIRSKQILRLASQRSSRCLLPRFPLFRVMVLSQVANGVLLPFVLIFVLLLVNDRELMGSYVNSKWYNVVSWITVGVMIALTIAMVIAQARG